MKILFIYLAVVLAITFYVWSNIFKEGVTGTGIKDDSMTRKESEMNSIQQLINGYNKNGTPNGQSTDKDTKQLHKLIIKEQLELSWSMVLIANNRLRIYKNG
jgi:hypothetical protein